MNLLATKSAVLRVLLVDDEETPRDAMVTLLTAMGWEVEPCVSAMDALHRFESDEDEFDVILTCLLYTSPSPRDATLSRMPSSA